jgi:hypothetical protein
MHSIIKECPQEKYDSSQDLLADIKEYATNRQFIRIILLNWKA